MHIANSAAPRFQSAHDQFRYGIKAAPIDFYDFFSGCGGTSCGMRQAGMTVRLGIDIDPDSERTYRENFPGADFLRRDIRTLDVSEVSDLIKRYPDRALLFGACAPCQPFSKQNQQKDKNDGRRHLLSNFNRFIEAFLPEYVFVENVPGLQVINEQNGPFADFLSLLRKLDYFYDYAVVMAYHYGVPQSRRRLVLIASRLGQIKFPLPTHGLGTGDPKLPTVWHWIGDLPPLNAGESHPSIPNHRAARLSDLNYRRIAATPEGGGRVDWPEELMLNCHKRHGGHTDVYGRMLKDRPSAALTTRCISLSNGRFGHPEQNRAISVREAASLQTFPRDFVFHGSLNSMARQVGNAVPVEMARVFGEVFVNHYEAFRTRGSV